MRPWCVQEPSCSAMSPFALGDLLCIQACQHHCLPITLYMSCMEILIAQTHSTITSDPAGCLQASHSCQTEPLASSQVADVSMQTQQEAIALPATFGEVLPQPGQNLQALRLPGRAAATQTELERTHSGAHSAPATAAGLQAMHDMWQDSTMEVRAFTWRAMALLCFGSRPSSHILPRCMQACLPACLHLDCIPDLHP